MPLVSGRAETQQVPDKAENSSSGHQEPMHQLQPSPPASLGLDGVITALISKLPKSNSSFPLNDRKKWLTMMEMALEMAYGPEGES